MIDELNNLHFDEKKIEQQMRSYFSEMPMISEEQIEERTNFAKKMFDLMMLFFAMVGTTDALGEMQDIDYYLMMLIRRYEDNIGDSFGDDLLMASYIASFAQQMVNNTLSNVAEPYTLSEDRAFLVSVNEANTVAGNAEYMNAIRSGKTHKEWLTENDDKVRLTHREVTPKIAEIRQYFHVGSSLMLYPHDAVNGSAKEIVNCRCHVKYFVDSTNDYQSNITKLFKHNASIIPNDIRNDVINGNVKNATNTSVIDDEKTFTRGKTLSIKSHKSSISKNRIYVSDDSTIDDNGITFIDNLITKVLQIHRIANEKNLPTIIINSGFENPKGALASYIPAKNILFIDENMSSIEGIQRLQRDVVLPNSIYSTFTHEYYHWKDAQEYIKINGIMDENFEAWVQAKSKSEVDFLIDSGYNIDKISAYANLKLQKEEYDEVYAEYRTLKLLEE